MEVKLENDRCNSVTGVGFHKQEGRKTHAVHVRFCFVVIFWILSRKLQNYQSVDASQPGSTEYTVQSPQSEGRHTRSVSQIQEATKHKTQSQSPVCGWIILLDIKVFQQNIINVITPSCSLVDICVNCCQDHWTNAWVMDRRFQILIISSLSLNWQKFPHGASSRFPEWNGWTKWKHNASGPRLTPVWRVYSVAEWNCEWSFFGFALLSTNMQQMELSFYKMLLLLLIYLGCWWWKAWVENQNNEQTVFL